MLLSLPVSLDDAGTNAGWIAVDEGAVASEPAFPEGLLAEAARYDPVAVNFCNSLLSSSHT